MREFCTAVIFYLLSSVASMASVANVSNADMPNADMIVVYKADHLMELYSNGTLIRHYSIHLGFNPQGMKTREGDGRTPEGLYTIVKHNANSQYHKSLLISYPGPEDRGNATLQDVNPGGQVMIHGLPNRIRNFGDPGDWTNGCIAVDNRSIEEIYASVKDGTPIMIVP